jgi:Domain of unknown function (DUF4432)
MRLPGAVDLRLRPERGLDLATASWDGTPLAWTTAVGEVPGTFGDWWASWGGGLMTTCGLDNVGAASDGLPLHGTYTYLPARDVAVDGCEACGVVEDARGVRLHRRVRSEAERPFVEVRDVTVNASAETQPAPLLYHCNLPWGEVEIDSDEVVPRDAAAAAGDWRTLGSGPERVYEHLGASYAAVRVGRARVKIRSSLPRLWQWVDPALGVVGIEPANCSVLGRAADRAAGRLPMMAAGAARATRLRIRVRRGLRVTSP